MIVLRGQYPELEQFMGGWFHEDWADNGETMEEVVRDYKSECNAEQIRTVCFEMNAFVANYGADSYAAFRKLWTSVDPVLLGHTVTSFFEEVKRILTY
jgi:hypothetical protein